MGLCRQSTIMNTKFFRQSQSLSIKVADLLRNAIIRGELKPGGSLNELFISAKLGTSRSPVREAFRILESENLVDIYSRKGAFVKSLSVKEVKEIYKVISIIESSAIWLAENNMNANREKELKSIIQQLEKTLKNNDIQKFMTSSMRLHNFIIKSSENSFLIRIYSYLQPQRERLRRVISMRKNDMAESLKEHLAISKSLLKHDFEKAEFLLKNHYHKGALRILENLQKTTANADSETEDVKFL